jgi:predicted GH43/DUF377 family glycosyl hydrolase
MREALMKLKRHEDNPIVRPGKHHWRRVATFNPGVVLDGDGVFWMLERACSSLAPLFSHFGLLRSDDGVHFELASDEPVFTASQLGTPRGTVEDARVVRIDGTYYMTYVHRNYVASCYPNGVGIPLYADVADVPPGDLNNYRSGVAKSDDLVHWEDLGLVTAKNLDDRDCVLFPEKIGGRFAMLRRPMNFVGPEFGCDGPSIWLSWSDDLINWDRPQLVATPDSDEWEGGKIGAGATPMKTDEGWLIIYHGVDNTVTYRSSVMLLDLEDPTKVIARSPDYILEPEEYYERVGLIIPNVVFPSANVIKDGTVYVYYGCCDTCISLATAPLSDLLDYVLQYRR